MLQLYQLGWNIALLMYEQWYVPMLLLAYHTAWFVAIRGHLLLGERRYLSMFRIVYLLTLAVHVLSPIAVWQGWVALGGTWAQYFSWHYGLFLSGLGLVGVYGWRR